MTKPSSLLPFLIGTPYLLTSIVLLELLLGSPRLSGNAKWNDIASDFIDADLYCDKPPVAWPGIGLDLMAVMPVDIQSACFLMPSLVPRYVDTHTHISVTDAMSTFGHVIDIGGCTTNQSFVGAVNREVPESKLNIPDTLAEGESS